MGTTRAYVDARITDTATAQEAATVAAAHWNLEAPTILRHGMNVIFRAGSVVLRVATPSAPAEVSIELADVLARHDIPVPLAARPDVVRHGGMSVTAWPFVEASGQPIDWAAVGRVVRRVHGLSTSDLPDTLPVPAPTTFPWWNFESMFDDVRGVVDDAAIDGMRSALAEHAGWDQLNQTVVCHGDVHPGNVIMTVDGPLLIDWDLLCAAPAGWDHAPMMTWTERWGGEPDVYEAFADGYGWSARGDSSGEAFAELRLVAATLMRVKAGMSNPTAMPEAERRLAHWRGDPDAETWQAQ